MTDVETLFHGIRLNRRLVPDDEPFYVLREMELELLQKILEDQAIRLSRIEKALGLEPLSEEEKKANAQAQWFSGSEPWRETIRNARRG